MHSLSALYVADPLLPFAESNSQRVEACNLKNTSSSPKILTLLCHIPLPHFLCHRAHFIFCHTTSLTKTRDTLRRFTSHEPASLFQRQVDNITTASMSYPAPQQPGYYGPPPQQGYGQYPPPQQQMYYQQGPPPPQEEPKKDRGCLTACLATLCCCWLCGETCECCLDCLDCCDCC